ncbi:probable serine/threonine-protein phosphatase 2A regulatory subunit B'' subunit TON2, partial [Tanacetum coccineum]
MMWGGGVVMGGGIEDGYWGYVGVVWWVLVGGGGSGGGWLGEEIFQHSFPDKFFLGRVFLSSTVQFYLTCTFRIQLQELCDSEVSSSNFFFFSSCVQVSLTQARIDMSELDEDSDGFLQHHEMEAYIRGLIPNLAQLRDLPTMFVQMYCCIASQKFFFFCDPIRRGKACIKKVLLSNCSGTHGTTSDVFLALDKDMNGSLSKQELREYTDGTLTDIFIERAFDEHLRRGKSGNANAREMDFESFLDFVLALENKDSPEGITYLFKCLDLNGRGFLTTADIHTLF